MGVVIEQMKGPYDLHFDNYAWAGSCSAMPEKAGIYCMYSVKVVGNESQLDKLEYIGKALNLKQRIEKHCRKPELDADGRPTDKSASPSEYLYNHDNPKAKCFYTYALLDGRSLETCEASMIKQFKPDINTKYTKTLGCHAAARIVVSGKYAYAPISAGTYDIEED